MLSGAIVGVAPPAQADDPQWVATWGRAAGGLTNSGDCNPCSARNTLHVTIGGSKIRLKVSNALGTTAQTISRTTVSLPYEYNSARAIPGSLKTVTFNNGQQSITLEPGEDIYSDPLDYVVEPDSDLHVSFDYVGNSRLTHHSAGSRNAAYIWRSPNHGTANQENPGPAAGSWGSYYTVTDVDVLPPEGEDAPAGAVVLFGDSITDGSESTRNADDRWADRLSDRINRLPAHARLGVVNAGIGGNRLLTDDSGNRGQSALNRFDRDVIQRAGIKSVVIFEGINDLQIQPGQTTPVNMIAALENLANRARQNGISPIGATLGPWKGWGSYNETYEQVRQQVNSWIRTTDSFDHVIDFDAVLRNPADGAAMKSDYDSGDKLHPGPQGYAAMANEVDLAILGGYERPGSIEVMTAPEVRRDVKTFVTAKITAAQTTENAQVRFALPDGWHTDQAPLVNLGPLAAGESAVASITASANTTGPRLYVQIRADGIFDGLVTSKSNQMTINYNVGARDEVSPTTSMTVAPSSPGATGWYTQKPTLNITAIDNLGGFTYIERRTNAGEWGPHVGALVVEDGDNTITARSYDAEANVSDSVSRLIKVDSTAPTATAVFEPTSRVVTVTSADATSGIAATEYRIGAGAWRSYSQPVVMAPAAAVVEYRARDKAGNSSVVGQVTVPAGATTPSKSASATSVSVKPNKPRYGGAAQISVNVTTSNNSTATGSVVVREGTRVIGSANLSGGSATITLRGLTVGRRQLAVAYNGSATVAASVQPVVINVAKAKASVSVKAKPGKTGNAAKRIQVTATVKSTGVLKGKKLAQVTVKRGKKTVAKKKVKVTAKGKAKFRTGKLKAGKHKVTVKFLGTATAGTAKGSAAAKVK